MRKIDRSVSITGLLLFTGALLFFVYGTTDSAAQAQFAKPNMWGDDVTVATGTVEGGIAVTYDSDFNQYAVRCSTIGAPGYNMYLYNSTDDGQTWQRLPYSLEVYDLQYPCPQLLTRYSGGEDTLLLFHVDGLFSGRIVFTKLTTTGVYVLGTSVVAGDTDTITYFSVCSNLDGDSLLVVYELNEATDATNDVHSVRSTDGGNTWVNDIRVDEDGRHPDVAYGIDGYVYLVYQTSLGGDSEIEFRKSTDFGFSWGSSTWLTEDNWYQGYPKVAALHTQPANSALVWVTYTREWPADNLGVSFMYSTNSGANWSGHLGLADDTEYDEQACDMVVGRSMEDSVVYASYLEYRYEFPTEESRIYTIRASVGNPVWNEAEVARVSDHFAAKDQDARLVCQGTMMLCGADVRPAFLYAGKEFVDNYDDLYFDGFCWVTDVEEEEGEGVNRPQFSLSNNYPNPFNPETKIQYTVGSKQTPIRLTIYNVLGQKVTTLADEPKRAGTHHVIWDGKNDEGKEVASGIYFYQLKAGGFTETKKMLLLK
jgi:hypothetical protein